MKRVFLRILIVFGVVILVGATGIIAEYAGFYAFFANIPILALIFVLVRLFVKSCLQK